MDATKLKAQDRVHHGLPPVFHNDTQYGHELQGDRIVCIPLRLRRIG